MPLAVVFVIENFVGDFNQLCHEIASIGIDVLW